MERRSFFAPAKQENPPVYEGQKLTDGATVIRFAGRRVIGNKSIWHFWCLPKRRQLSVHQSLAV